MGSLHDKLRDYKKLLKEIEDASIEKLDTKPFQKQVEKLIEEMHKQGERELNPLALVAFNRLCASYAKVSMARLTYKRTLTLGRMFD